MAEDSTFLRDLLASQNALIHEQVSDNDSSINEFGCEALMVSSDDESSSCSQGTIDKNLSKIWIR